MAAAERTLERLAIEVIGKEVGLKEFLDRVVKDAQTTADAVTKNLTGAFGTFSDAATSVEQLGAALTNLARDAGVNAQAFDDLKRNVKSISEEQRAAAEATAAAVTATGAAARKMSEDTTAAQKSTGEFADTTADLSGFIEALQRNLGEAGKGSLTLTDALKALMNSMGDVGDEAEVAAAQQKLLDEAIKQLSERVKTSRNQWAARVTDDREFEASTRSLRGELLNLAKEFDLTTSQMQRMTQASAYAQRGIDSVNKVASRGGLAWTTQIALANQFGQAVRNLGPVGQVAATSMGFIGNALGHLQGPLKATDMNVLKLSMSLTRFALVTAPLAGLLAAVAGGAALTKMALNAAKLAGDLDLAAAKTGTTVEALQELQHAARATGTPLESLTGGLERLQRSAGEAAAGNKALQATFNALGVDLRDGVGKMKDSAALFADVAEGLKRAGSEADKARITVQLFGRQGADLALLLREGRDGVRELREEAHRLGLVISGDAILSLTQFEAQVAELKQQFTVATTEIAAAFLPMLRDFLVPLLQNEVIPWLQNVVDEVYNFAQAFLDTTPAGEAFRRETIKNLQAVMILGRGVIATAAAVVGGVNMILAVGSFAYGAGEGLRGYIDDQGNMNALLKEREHLTQAILYNQQQLKQYEVGSLGYENVNANLRRAEERLEEFDRNHPGGVLAAMWTGGVDRAGNLVNTGAAAFEVAFDVLTADIEAMVNAWVENLPAKVERPTRRAGAELGSGLGDGIREALADSLKYAQEQAQKAMTEFSFATTDADRERYMEAANYWNAVAAEILARFTAGDPMAPVKAWVTRLEKELETGVKTAREVIATARPTFLNLGTTLDSLIAQGLGASKAADIIRAQMQELERVLTAAGDDVTQAIQRALRGVAGDAAAPIVTQRDVDAMLNIRQLRKQIEEAIRLGLDPSEVQRLTTELMRAMTSTAPQLASVAAQQVEEYNQRAQRAYQAAVRAQKQIEQLRLARIKGEDQPIVSQNDINAALGVQNIRRQIEEAIRLGLDPNEVERLTTQLFTAMTSIAPELASVAEQQVKAYQQRAQDAFRDAERAQQRIEQLRLARIKAEDRDARPTVGLTGVADISRAITEAQNANIRLAETQAKLTGNTTALKAAYEAALPRLETAMNLAKEGTPEWYAAAEGVIAVTAALNGLTTTIATTLDPTAFDAWLASVNRIAITLDPIEEAGLNLALMMAAGKITAEQYATALDVLADAAERYANIPTNDKTAETLQKQYADAQTTINDLLSVQQTHYRDLRESIEAAFTAGIISVEEFNAALRSVSLLELKGNFEVLAQELGGIAGIIPSLAAGITHAVAAFTAGHAADGITFAFRAATEAVEGLKSAFEDSSRAGEAALDLLIGAAATIGTIVGGPAVGQAIGAIGGFIKSILGDLTNGLAEVDKKIRDAIGRSAWLGEGIIRAIADANTSQVSRGGLLGLLGFTKMQLDDAGFSAGVTMAEGIAEGLVNTLRSGDFQQAWDAMVNDILINGIIQQFMATEAVQRVIQDAFERLSAGDSASAAALIDTLRGSFQAVWEQIQAILGKPVEEMEATLFQLPSASVSVMAAPQWALELTSAIGKMGEAGDKMLTAADLMIAAFTQPPVPAASRGLDAMRSL